MYNKTMAVGCRASTFWPLALFRKSDLRVRSNADPLTISIGAHWQGWLDITYLSPDGQFRLSRGNKASPLVSLQLPDFSWGFTELCTTAC
jgi:hypothetical protein